LQKGWLYLLAARPGMGKTGLALNIAKNSGTLSHRVAVFTLEMKNPRLINRWVAAETGIDSIKLASAKLDDHHWPMVAKAIGKLEKLNIWLDDSGNTTVTSIRNKAKMLHMRYGLDLIIIDYLQLVNDSDYRANRTQQVSKISRGLKLLAQELNIPIFCLSQLNRAVEQRTDKHPMLADLRDSGSLEQDADVVMFLYRDDYYNADAIQGLTDLDVAKQRDGPTGRVCLHFTKETTTFVEVEEHEKEPLPF